jgi:succinate dehydrogenase / fumarate reductase cytochrome b subunit
VGKKWVMAVTGIMLLGFVIAHMVGNLKLYLGAIEHNGAWEYDANIYGEFLRELLVPIFPRTVFLWLLRLGLIAAFALHIHAMYSLTRLNLASNVEYASKRDWLASNFASRSMRYSGIIVLAYLVFHLADLTWGVIPGYDFVRGDTHENVVGSLSNPVVAAVYIVANALLAMHIFHGAYSMFQSLGVSNPAYDKLRRHLATALAVIILVGNVSFPVAVLTGIIDLDDRVPSAEESSDAT